jgi:MSHA biogenesis protein MshQ
MKRANHLLGMLGLIAMTVFAQGAGAVSYANKSIVFNWINTSTHTHVGSGTIPYKFNGTIAPGTTCGTAPPILDDTISDAIPFGFNFNYGGIVFTSARIMSNGRLQFNNNTACGFGSPVTQLPFVYYNSATDNLNYSMRIYGNDLDPTPQADAPYTTACTSAATCYISYASIGTAPNRQFVVTWNNIPEWAAGGSTSGNYSLQLILNEDGSFIYQYGVDTAGPQAATAQVGWQVSQTDFDVPSVGLPANNSAILFYIPSPVAQYHFQQSAWTAPGQVLDTSGGTPVYNGTALGGATPGVGYVCNGAVIPNNTSAATIDAINTGISVPTALGGIGTIDFWYKSNAAWVGGGDAQLLDATTTNNQWFFAVKRNNGNVRFVITDSTGTIRAAETPANNIAAGTWTHIALTWSFNALAANNSDHMSVYINGVQTVLSTFTTSGTVSAQVGTLYLGDNRSTFTGSNGTVNSANGTLDEVNIYNFEGGTGLIQRDKNYTASCGPDHLVIQSSGSGLTCAANTLTVVACQDVACATPYTGGETGTLSATGTVNWDGTTGGAAGAGFAIPAGSSSVTKNVQVATAGSVVFGITTPTPVPTNVTTCNFGSPACTFTANTAGFIFSNTTTGNTYTIPDQVSGIAVTGLYLRAVQASTTNPAVCTPAIINSTTSVNMGYTCNNPAACQPGNLATINATAIAPAGTAVSLAFDANGSAPITVRYDDVGKITLNPTATVTPFGGATAITLTGFSNAFVVAPHHFGFSSITAGLIKAGNNFSATVTAYNGLATPTATANFGKETVPEGVTLTTNLVSGNNPTLANNVIAGTEFGAGGMVNDPNGVATVNNLGWGEVGLITLTANLTSGSYLGSALTATGTSGSVGRFIADHFDTVVVQGCAAGSFTYSGQPYTVQVTARNLAGGIIQNYNTACGYSKSVTLSNAGSAANLNIGWPPGTPTQAMASTQFNNPATCGGMMSPVTGPNGTQNNVIYTFAVPTVPTTVTMRAVDTDSVTSSGFTEGTTEIRTGRVKLSNVHGSELLRLPVPIALQYYSSNGWAKNTADTCSVISAGNFAFGSPGNNLAACETAMMVSGSAPNYILKLAAPGSGNNGWTDLTLNLGTAATGNTCTATNAATGFTGIATTANLPWLQFPWSGAGATNPSTRATFGVYKGANEFIYLRENY